MLAAPAGNLHLRFILIYCHGGNQMPRHDKPTPPPGYTAQEMADALRLSVRTIRDYIQQGKIRAVNVSSAPLRPRWRITAEDYAEFVNRNPNRPRTPAENA